MKITAFILLAFCIQVSANTLAQNVTLSEHKAPLEKVINEIKHQTGYSFFYNQDWLRQAQPVDVQVGNSPLELVLKLCFASQPFDYAIVNKTIVLKLKEKSKAENKAIVIPITVSGRVTDSADTPLIGARVGVKGTNIATATDARGLYKLQIPDTSKTLIISYVGYKTKEVLINNLRIINIKLESDARFLNDVFVVGYSTQSRSKVTGAISQVGAEVFKNRPITNIAQGLQGAIPNLNISFGDGQLNRGGTFNIRGFTSINGGSPLVLIDGTPGNINLVNPEDVESVSVLKDAASAAIYGGRASFGVILVNTKKAKKGKTEVRYTSNFGIGKPTRVPQVISDPLEDATIQNQAYRGYTGTDAPDILNVINYLQQRKANPSLPELGVDASGNFIRGASTDWYGEFYNDSAPFSKNYLNISGAKDNTGYYLSFGLEDQKGMFKQATDDYKLYNGRIKLDNQLASWIKIYDNAEYNQQVYNTPNKFVTDGGYDVYRYLSLYANPYEAIRTPNGNYTIAGASVFGQLNDAGRSNTRGTVFKNTAGFQTNFFNNKLRINGDYTYFLTQTKYDTQYLSLRYENKLNSVINFNNPNYYYNAFSESNDQTVNLFAEYEQLFGGHHIKALAGYNQEINHYTNFNARRDGNISTDLGSLNLTNGIATVGGSAYAWALRGIFGRFDYDYKSKYLVEFNGRYDGTSRFAPSGRYGFFPSVSAGWVISKEDFFKPLANTFDIFKIRGSYGSLGNQQVGNYAYISTMTPYTSTSLLDNGGQLPLAVNAPGLIAQNLTWETTSTLNVGFDLTALKSRLNVGFDWYNRKTTNMLTKSKTLPSVLGTTEPLANAADLSTKGWELSAGWQDKVDIGGKPFGYNFSFVLSDNKSVITRYDNPNKLLTDYYVGMQVGDIWGYKTLGFFKTDAESATSPDQSKLHLFPGLPLAGDIKFADLNGDNVINNGKNTADNPGDMQIIGNTSPRYSYGANLGFDFHNFSVAAFIQGVGKRDFYPGPEAAVFWGFYNRWNQPVYTQIYGNYWTPDNPDAYFPRLRAYEALTTDRELGAVQTRYLQSAAYLRLKSLSVGYALPSFLLRKIKISNARVFFVGQNLFESTKLSTAFDPEGINDEQDSSRLNGAGFVYPIQRTFTFGLELTL